MSFTPKQVYFNETPISFLRHASHPVLCKVVLLALPTHAVLDAGLLLHRLGEPQRPFEEVAMATTEHVFFVVWKSWIVVLYQTLFKKSK